MENGLVITKENLKKACEVFDLDYDKIVKSETSNPFLKDTDKKDELNKAESGEDLGKEKEQNADLLFKALGVEPEALKVAIQVLPKVVEMKELVKGLENTLGQLKLGDEKESIVNKVGTLITGYNEIVAKNKELKDDLKKAKEDVASLTNKVGIIEKVPLGGRKSITSEKIEKSFSDEEENSLKGKTVYSISKNKQIINSLLGDRMQEELAKGIQDGPFSKAAMSFEASGRLSRPIIEALNQDNIVLVQ